MNKEYIKEQGMFMVFVLSIMLLTNTLGFKIPLLASIKGLLVLGGIAFIGLIISKIMSNFIKLPTMMYVSLLALILASPISPIKEQVIKLTGEVAFMTPGTIIGALAGLSLSKDIKSFVKMGWKYIIITIFVITGTFIFSTIIADLVLKIL